MESKETKPQINADERRLNALSEEIIGAAFEVSNVLGVGFLEKVYENALNIELEVKAVKEIDTVHFAQCLNYLRITGLKLCLLINFSKPRVEIKRIVNGI
ncbi:MAG: GxxExxY protein [Candidatus Methanoperedenaceae archaeon]|nr:GxxExxY protein [Candidatus Methanoperedenaceae archaeon]